MTQNTNPFVLPGFGQSGDMAGNPMLASMEMMRKAWEGLAGASGFDKSFTAPGASPEDLERRIADLRAVENWLRMNLSMLSSTIQALEVQQSTLATLQAFVASAGGAASSQSAPASPLDVALGIRRGPDVSPSADSSGLFGDPVATPSAKPQQADPAPEPSATSSALGPSDTPDPAAGADKVMQSWWDMLQNQFDNLTTATTATLQGAEAMQEAASTVQKKAVDSTREAAEALKKSTASGVSPARKTAAKKAIAKKASVKKSAAKKTVAKKSAAKKTAAKKAATNKTAAKKAAQGTRSTRQS